MTTTTTNMDLLLLHYSCTLLV